jgi:hypothetical protein
MFCRLPDPALAATPPLPDRPPMPLLPRVLRSRVAECTLPGNRHAPECRWSDSGLSFEEELPTDANQVPFVFDEHP